MLFSYKQLKRMANLPESITLEKIVNAINSIGFEVEETYPYGNVQGIKFGKVLEVSKNPNGDKLNVCLIEFDDKNRTIQTTATNVVPGKVVIAFVPGSKMGDITMNEKEMKGIVSEGMLSSLNELGIDKDHIRESYGDGIMFYDDVKDLSINPIEYLYLQDIIIDIDILSNRSDAQSYFVMARELSAYFKTEVTWPINAEGKFDSSIKVENGLAKTLAMFEASDAPKVSIREQILLAKYGLKSINDIVDLTNLTLIMTGQPTHAYDLELVGNNFKANKYSGNIRVLGNLEVTLENDLVISSDDKPVSVAGVIGGANTGVKETTKDFIVEMGIFATNDVRKSSKATKVTNYSASQSAKNLSSGTTEIGLNYLMSKLNNYSNVVNFKNKKPKLIKYDPKFTSQLAGFDITKDSKWEETITSLEILGFKFLVGEVEVPTYRHDIESIQDINEEIFRFFGYDSFEPVAPKVKSTHIAEFKDYKSIIAGQGYQEVTTYSLISKDKNIFNPFDFKDEIKLETYVSKEREVIRSSQIHSMLEVLEYNFKRKITDISLFSHGMIGDGKKSYILTSTIKSFKELKQDLVNLLPKGVMFLPLKNDLMHPGVSANILLKDKIIGFIGKVHPSLTNVDTFVAEILLEEPKYNSQVKEYNSEPLKSRDITFELKEKENISKYIKDIDAFSIKVVDEFSKEGINRVTVSFKGSEEQIDMIDKEFN